MSNLPTLPGQGVPTLANMAVPAYMAAAAQQQSSMADIGSSMGSLSIQTKGGQITFLGEDGKAIGNQALADGRIVAFPDRAMTADIIIVSANPTGGNTYRQWFATEYTEGEAVAPDCWSPDGEIPSPKSARPQGSTCANCPQNVKGTSKTGRGAACQHRKNLAVVFADDPEMRVFRLNLPATAMFGKSERQGWYTLTEYARMLANSGVVWEGVRTQISFSDGTTRGIRFAPVGYLTEEQYNYVVHLRQQASTADVIAVDFNTKETTAAPAALPTPTPAAAAIPPPNPAPMADPKQALLQNPYFPAHLRDWAMHPSVTVDAIRAEAAKVGVAL